MVIGKTEEAATHLADQFFDRTNDRRYLALVWGDLQGGRHHRRPHGRSPKDRTVMAVPLDGEQGKPPSRIGR
jgi:23S rRNA pseudouridine1911/1915/1917 synthase